METKDIQKALLAAKEAVGKSAYSLDFDNVELGEDGLIYLTKSGNPVACMSKDAYNKLLKGGSCGD